MTTGEVEAAAAEGEPDEAIRNLIKQYEQVFNELVSLPPSTELDHSTQLIYGSSINVKPYRYFNTRK